MKCIGQERTRVNLYLKSKMVYILISGVKMIKLGAAYLTMYRIVLSFHNQI